MKKKELKKPKEPNPFLNLINISKNNKNRYKTPIKQRIQYQRSFTPIELIKNKSINKKKNKILVDEK